MTYKRIFGLIFHEGMPMLLYAQALIWGEERTRIGRGGGEEGKKGGREGGRKGGAKERGARSTSHFCV